MNKSVEEKVVENKARHAAFSDFLENGIDFVKKFYPGQVAFVLENKDKSFDEVYEILSKEFDAITRN